MNSFLSQIVRAINDDIVNLWVTEGPRGTKQNNSQTE